MSNINQILSKIVQMQSQIVSRLNKTPVIGSTGSGSEQLSGGIIPLNIKQISGSVIELSNEYNCYKLTPTATLNLQFDNSNVSEFDGGEFYLMIDFTNGVQTVNFPDAFQWKNNESMPNITAQNLYIFKCLYLYTDPIAYTGEFITSVINDDYDSGIICTNDPNNVFYGQIYMNEATITDNQELTIGKNAQINTLNAVNNTESADHLMLTTINVYGSIGEIKISNTLDDPDGTPEYEDLFHINVDGGTISKITGIHNPSQDWTISEYDIGTITISDGYVKSNTNGCSFNLNMTGGYFTGSVYSFNISGGTCGVLEHNYDAMGSADGYIFDGVVINSISYNSGTLTINGGTIHNLYAGYMSGQNYVINGGLIENFDLEDESEYPSCGIESLIINGGTVKITARLKNYMDNNNITPSISENATVIYLDE